MSQDFWPKKGPKKCLRFPSGGLLCTGAGVPEGARKGQLRKRAAFRNPRKTGGKRRVPAFAAPLFTQKRPHFRPCFARLSANSRFRKHFFRKRPKTAAAEKTQCFFKEFLDFPKLLVRAEGYLPREKSMVFADFALSAGGPMCEFSRRNGHSQENLSFYLSKPRLLIPGGALRGPWGPWGA